MNGCNQSKREDSMFRFTVPGRAVPAVRMTRRGMFVRRQAQRYLEYKEKVAWVARQHKVKKIDGPVSIEIVVYLHKGRQGDVDNYAKAITDSLNGIAYEDDVQVKRLLVEKRECEKDEERTEVIINSLEVMGSAK